MANIMKYIVLSVIYLLDSVDKALRFFFGIKLYKLTKERIIGRLTPAELGETKHKDVALPFQLFIKGLEEDEGLSFSQRFFMMKMIKNSFATRVEIKTTLEEKPEILEIPVRRPIFIIGMPRTGTTLLSRLIGQDPGLRAPMMWEMGFPCPPGKVENFREDPRFKKANMKKKIDNWLVGEDVAKKIHISVADEPEECLTFTRLQFWQYFNYLRLPALHEHESWFLTGGTDHDYCKLVYEYYKKQLQLLSYGQEPKTFLLKCNVHLLALEALREVFPDACFIYTYRPMSQAVASFCSTMDHLFSFYGPVDAKFGNRVLRLCAELTNRGAKSFEKFDQLPQGQNPVFLASYKDLAADPVKMVTSIYNYFGIPISKEAERIFQKYVDYHPQNKHGKHSYSLAQYGLTIDDLHQEMAPYVAYFKKRGFSDAI